MNEAVLTKFVGFARVGRRGDKYALYLREDLSQELMKYARTKARVYIGGEPNPLIINGTLAIAREFKRPRIVIFLPKALNPTWQRLYDKELVVVVEIQADAGG